VRTSDGFFIDDKGTGLLLHLCANVPHSIVEDHAHFIIGIIGIVALFLEENIASWILPSLLRSIEI
jgi:hypothetical protein